MATKWICYRITINGRFMYVEALPGDGGKDWGYTSNGSEAIQITTYWKNRFAANMKYVNSQFNVRKVR